MYFKVKSVGDFMNFDFHFFFHRKKFLRVSLNNRKIKTRSEIGSNLTIKKQEKLELHRSCVSLVNFEQVSTTC